MSKRSAVDGVGCSASESSNICQPLIKKFHNEPHQIGPVASLEEMDVKVLKFQRERLWEDIQQRKCLEAELRQRVDLLETRHKEEFAVLSEINYMWNKFNDDIYVLLNRFDAETSDESENKAMVYTLTELSTLEQKVKDEMLANRVEVSIRGTKKFLNIISNIWLREDKMHRTLLDFWGENSPSTNNLDDITKVFQEEHLSIIKENNTIKDLNKSMWRERQLNSVTEKELKKEIALKDEEIAKYKNQIDELQHKFDKVNCKNMKLEARVAQACKELKAYHEMYGDITDAKSATGKRSEDLNVNSQHLEELQRELEEYRELSNNRLKELNEQHEEHQETLKELEKLKMDFYQIPKSIIQQTPEYKSLELKYSVLLNDSMQIKGALDETRKQLELSKNQHLSNIEAMEYKEWQTQRQMQNDLIKAQDLLEQNRKEYESLERDFNEGMAKNREIKQIHCEMSNGILSLMKNNRQLKAQVEHFERKYNDACAENSKLLKALDKPMTKLAANKEQTNSTTECFDSSTKDDGDNGRVGNSGSSNMDAKALVLHENASSTLANAQDNNNNKENEEKQSSSTSTQSACSADSTDMKPGKPGNEDYDKKTNKRKLNDIAIEQQNQVAPIFGGSQEEATLLKKVKVMRQEWENVKKLLNYKERTHSKLVSEHSKTLAIQKILREQTEALQELLKSRCQQLEACNVVVHKLEAQERIFKTTLACKDKELQLLQKTMELNKTKVKDLTQWVADLKLHSEKHDETMTKATQNLAEKTSAIEAGAYKIRRLQEQLAQFKRKAERNAKRIRKLEKSGVCDGVMLAEMRENKETLTCPICKVKRRDAVLSGCGHVFCYDCLHTRYMTRQRMCPTCNFAFGAKSYLRIFLN